MWHQINIKTSEQNQEVVRKLTNKLPPGTKENVIARIALGYSLQSGVKFSQGEFANYDSKGKEYKDHILFDAKYREFYIALIAQYYEVSNAYEHIPKYIKLHIDHGLELLDQLFESNPKYTIFDFLYEHLDRGISALENVEVSLDAVKNNNQGIEKGYFTSPIKIDVGTDPQSDNPKEPIYLTFNDVNKYNNCHIAVAGNSGTGKTQFALELLSQISEKSNGQVNFIYLDFKGVKQDDLKALEPFFDRTKSNFIDAPQKPFPINPLTFIDNINEVNKKMGIQKFVDIIAKYANIGKRQEQTLKDATKEAFIDRTNGTYPSINDIYDKVIELYDDKRDTLTEVLENLSDLNVFAESNSGKNNFFSQNYYLSLSGY